MRCHENGPLIAPGKHASDTAPLPVAISGIVCHVIGRCQAMAGVFQFGSKFPKSLSLLQSLSNSHPLPSIR